MLFRPADLRVIAGVAVSLALLIYAFRKRNSNVLFFFSVCWFFIALLPVSSIYPVNAFYMAEHWLYLPSIGFFIIVSKGLADLYTCKKARIFELFFAIIIVAYSCLTIMQNIYWRDPISFYTRTLRYIPSSARVYNNLGYTYFCLGKYSEAIAIYNKAIAINPKYAEAYDNLGVACMNLNKHEEAINAYKRAIEIKPKFANPYNNLGIALSQAGKSAEALASFKQAIEIDPHFGDAYFNAALEYLFQKQYSLAIQYCDKARVLGYQVPRRLLKILEPYRK
jgi:superkiller protein 3